VRLAPNPTYHLGPPHIARFEFRAYNTVADLAQALLDHQIDGATLPEDAGADAAAFRTDDRWTVHDLPAAPYYILYLDTRSPLFQDDEVRRALFQGLNRDALLADVAAGHGDVSLTGTPRGSWAFSGSEAPSFNPGEAATALELAGFFRGRDGIRSNAQNLRLAFSITTSSEPRRVAIAEEIARQWRAIGVSIEVEAVDAGTFFADRLIPRTYTASLALVDPGVDPDPYPFWHSSQVPPPGFNLANYADNRMDDAIERGRQTTDIARRKDLYALFDGYFIATIPSIPLYAPATTYVQSADVRGFEPQLVFSPVNRFANVNQWYVNTRVK
jgi:peptide/nickel transport system substrate-binding protein